MQDDPSDEALTVAAEPWRNGDHLEAPDPTLSPNALVAMARAELPSRIVAARHPSTPDASLRLLAADSQPEVRAAIAMNPSTSDDVAERLAGDPRESVREAAALRSSPPHGVLERLAWDTSRDVRAVVAVHPRRPEPIVRLMIAAGMDPLLGLPRMNEVAPPQIDAEGLAELSRRAPDSETARLLLGLASPSPEAVLKVFAHCPHARQGVAANARTPTDRVVELAADPCWEVRVRAVTHPALPEELVERLWNDENVHVCIRAVEAAAWRGLERVLLAHLSEHDATNQVNALAGVIERGGPAPPRAVVAPLVHHASAKVRSRTACRLPLGPDDIVTLRGDADWHVRKALGENPALPAAILDEMADAADEYLRWGVAENRKAPPATLARIAARALDDSLLWHALALNTATPPDVLTRLLDEAERRGDVASLPDVRAEVRRALARHPATPPDVLARLLDDADLHHYLARNPSTPADRLRTFAAARSNSLRKAVAGNRGAPVEIVAALALDPDPWVRLFAQMDERLWLALPG